MTILDGQLLQRAFATVQDKTWGETPAWDDFDPDQQAYWDQAAHWLAEALMVGGSDLAAAAHAVIDRWDSPNWKDGVHTGELIARLREAVVDAAAESTARLEARKRLTRYALGEEFYPVWNPVALDGSAVAALRADIRLLLGHKHQVLEPR